MQRISQHKTYWILLKPHNWCLGHFMPETLAQVATACCELKKTVQSLFEQAAHIAILLLQNFHF